MTKLQPNLFSHQLECRYVHLVGYRAEDNGRPKAEGKSSFSTTFYRIFSAQQTDSLSSGLPLSISKDKPSSPEKEMNTHLETSFLNWPTNYSDFLSFVSFHSASCLSLGDLGTALSGPASRRASAMTFSGCDTSPTVDCCSFSISRTQSPEELGRVGERSLRSGWTARLSCGDTDFFFFFFFLNAYAEERTRREGRQNSPLASQ